MTSRDDGGPAFTAEYGISLRDYFAGQALTLFTSNDVHIAGKQLGTGAHQAAAKLAYAVADAMLAARDQAK